MIIYVVLFSIQVEVRKGQYIKVLQNYVSLSLHNVHTLKFVIVNKSLNLTVMQINIRVAIDTLEHTLNFKLNLDVT